MVLDLVVRQDFTEQLVIIPSKIYPHVKKKIIFQNKSFLIHLFIHLDVHTEFERKISEFLGTEDTILYSQGFSTINSAIPSFCKRGDIIVA
jgi:hypothetical protein